MEPMLSFAETLRRNPYRFFFPLGILAALIGVGEWAFWTMGYSIEHVKLLHLTLQSQGFLSFFVIGFLLTAFPRFSGTRPATLIEIGIALAGGALFFVGALMKEWQLSQMGALILYLCIPFFAGRRLSQRTKELPPSFLLLAFGLLHAFVGTILSIVTNMGETHAQLYFVGRQMVQMGFLLCMVLGITAKLAPFLMGYMDDPASEGKVSGFFLPRAWEISAHALTGGLIFASFFLETDFPRGAFGLRAALVTIHFLLFAKIGRVLQKKTATIILFWISCWMIPLGLWFGFFLPRLRVAALHVIFIGGYSLMIFSFGMLVVLSHSGKAALLNGKLWMLKTIGLFTLLALGFRVAADFFPNRYMIFLHNASGFWVLAAVLWLFYALPKMRGGNSQH